MRLQDGRGTQQGRHDVVAAFEARGFVQNLCGAPAEAEELFGDYDVGGAGYGEQFGEDRLKDLLIRNQNLEMNLLMTKVMDAVVQWTSAAEMPDDMTLLVARVYA